MTIRDNNYNWTNEAELCSKEIQKALKPVLEKYKDKFSLEELFYMVSTEFNEMIMIEILDKRERVKKNE